MSDEFDPHKVSPFPVFTIRQSDEGPDTLDGVPIEPAHGEEQREAAATAAAARKATDHGYDAVRVRAHLLDGRRVDFVIRATGEVYDTTPDEPTTTRPRRRVLLAAIAMTSVLILALGGFFIARTITANNTPEPVASPTPPAGAGTSIPVGLPTDISTTASWTAP